MITQDQAESIAFMASPSTHGTASVERIDTHASIVFLAGERAYKMKRAVRYDYLDFSTADRRRTMCQRELAINQPLAPALYQRVIAVTREANGKLALGGDGTPVDWLIEMARFDQDGLFDRLAARSALDLGLMRPLAAAIAGFHARAARRIRSGGAVAMQWVVDGNDAGLREQGAGYLDVDLIARVTRLSSAAIDAHGRLLDVRRDAGLVRQCHGDLHLRNIVLIDGIPTLFDAVEFNDDIACIDVLYDVAFLLMDLWRRHLRTHANALWNAYLAESGELEGIALMPLFLSCRAAIRAKTSMTAANLTDDPHRRRELVDLARGYLTMAERLLLPAMPHLLAIGGLSGSGKSTVAHALAAAIGAAPGAIVVRSDEVRKQLFGVDSLVRLGAEAYTPEMSHRVYTTIAGRAAAMTAAGYSVIADATYARPADRDAIERVARLGGAAFTGVWLDAPADVLVRRVRERRADASDADATVVQRQLDEPLGTVDWYRIDASRSAAAVCRSALRHVKRVTACGAPSCSIASPLPAHAAGGLGS